MTGGCSKLSALPSQPGLSLCHPCNTPPQTKRQHRSLHFARYQLYPRAFCRLYCGVCCICLEKMQSMGRGIAIFSTSVKARARIARYTPDTCSVHTTSFPSRGQLEVSATQPTVVSSFLPRLLARQAPGILSRLLEHLLSVVILMRTPRAKVRRHSPRRWSNQMSSNGS